MKILIFSLVIILFIIFILLIFRTYQIQNHPNQKLFLLGTLPNPVPNGLYKGVVNIHTNWQGKSFDASASTGINSFIENGKQNQKYPFKTYIGKGIADNTDVLKIDYNMPENPFWLRLILDEIVQTAPNKYLGKVHLNIVPGIPFTLGYFQLTK